MADADVLSLMADGIPIEIAGHQFHARFTPHSVATLEARAGSMKKLSEMLNRLNPEHEDPLPLYENVFYLLGLALRHETIPTANGTRPVTEEWLLDNADSTRILEYSQVAIAALVQGLPKPAQQDEERPTPPPSKAAETNGSTGEDGSGSQPLSSGSVLASSGTT